MILLNTKYYYSINTNTVLLSYVNVRTDWHLNIIL